MPSTTLNYSIESEQLITPRPIPARAQPYSTAVGLIEGQEYFAYPHQKSIYLINLTNPIQRREIRHTAGITAVALSPKNSFIVAGDCQGRIRSWSLPSLQPAKEWQVLSGAIKCICFHESDDEETFFACGEGREYFAVAVYGEKVMPLSGPTKSCSSLCVSGSKLVLGSSDFSCTVFELLAPFPRQAPKFLKTLAGGHTNAVLALCGSEEHFFSAGADGQVISYSSSTLEVIQTKKCHNAAILGAELTEEGLFTVSTDGCLSQWNPQNLKLLKQCASSVALPQGQACSLAVSKESLLVTRLSGSTEFYPRREKEVEKEINFGHAKGVVKLWKSEAVENLIIHSESYDGEQLSWKFCSKSKQLQSFKTEVTTQPSTSHPSIPNAHVIAKSGEMVAWSDSSHSIHLQGGHVFWCHHSARVDALCWLNSKGVLLSGGVDGHLMAWSKENEREPIATSKLAHWAPITAICALDDEYLITSGQDCTLRLWHFNEL